MLKPLFLAVSVMSLPYATVAQTIRFDFDHDASFAGYRTYRMVTVGQNPAVNQLNDQRIRGAVAAELTRKGLRKVESGGDLLVGYQAAVDKQTEYTTFADGVGPGWGWRSGYSTTTASTIPVGTLAIDMFDAAKKQLVFRGTASGTLSDKPEKNADKIAKAVRKIFEKYPPKLKS